MNPRVTGISSLLHHSDIDDIPPLLQRGQNSPGYTVLLFYLTLSAILHVAVFLLIGAHKPGTEVPESITANTAIQATLYFPTNKKPEAKQETKDVELTPTTSQIVTSSNSTEQQPSYGDAAASRKQGALTSKQNLSNRTELSQLHSADSAKLLKTPPQENANKPLNFDIAASKFMKQLAHKRQKGMAEKAASAYQQHKNHPQILPQKNLSRREENYYESVKIEVDCNRSAAKIMSLISSNVGVTVPDRHHPSYASNLKEPLHGTVTCATLPEIEAFVQTRRGKTSDLLVDE